MKKGIVLVSTLLVVALLLFLTTKSTSQSFSKHYTVKMYSGDKVIASWEARDIGKVDGESLVFSTGSDLNPRVVRIHGSYSVEEQE